nr:hypothetical protein P5668_07975 [Bacillus subtilis]
MLSLAFIYKLAAAILQPLGGGTRHHLPRRHQQKRHLYFCSSRHCVSHVFFKPYCHNHSRKPHDDDEMKEAGE